MSLILIGMPSSGKTSIGRRVANSLTLSWYDTDDYFFENFSSPKDFFLTYGEEEFRKIEKTIICDSINKYQLLSFGGGGILIDGIPEIVRSHTVIYLYVDFTIIYKRMISSKKAPFIGMLFKDLKLLYTQRDKQYSMLANKRVDISELSLDEAVEKITQLISIYVHKQK
jgi:shikimate kinase